MPIALNPRDTFDYVLECDRDLPEEQQTVFVLRGLTVAQEAKVSDSMISTVAGSDEIHMRAGSHALTILRMGLRGWRNFKDESGADVPFEEDKSRRPRGISDECLDRLHPAWRTELANAIDSHGRVTSEEGNS